MGDGVNFRTGVAQAKFPGMKLLGGASNVTFVKC